MEAFPLPNETEGDRTFDGEGKLPSLPLPELDQTLQKYLDSCKGCVTPEEYQATEEIVRQFSNHAGPKLHRTLENRAMVERNWLEKWWLKGYLEFRGPLSLMNMSIMASLDFWKPTRGTQVHRSALFIHATLQLWKALREERIPQMKNNSGEILCMDQYRRVFSTCRVPTKNRDRLLCYFKTLREGYSPSHIVIFYKKRIYKVQVTSEDTAELLTPGDWFAVISQIKTKGAERHAVALLTESPRDIWAEARLHLMKLSPKNTKNIHDIESAIFCFAMLDDYPDTESDFMNLAACESYGDRWCDKFNLMCTENGKVIGFCEHTPVDGLVFGTLTAHNYFFLKEKFSSGKWDPKLEKKTSPNVSFKELTFDLDEEVHEWIEQAIQVVQDVGKKLKYFMFTFEGFGKEKLKLLNVHVAAFIQISLQLAYMRKHGKAGPTYETATTRAFHHGRTETIRSCTPEVVEFCQAMIQNFPRQKELFQAAYNKYIWMMHECRAGRGCDRHLLGLASAAEERGMALPKLFIDPSYRKTGGGANFVLSTSYSGVALGDAGCAPMREDGYGIFFRATDCTIHCCLTTYNPAPGIDACDFANYLEKAFCDVFALLQNLPARL